MIPSAAAGSNKEKYLIAHAIVRLLTDESDFLKSNEAANLWSRALIALLELFDQHSLRDVDIDDQDANPDDITLGKFKSR